ncbi:13963_t:CDS:2 [Ambispora leptoticha]|uniref:13963_t:CDS:1 n=1 Tax=Ambispora leptoticha TaxID=144679 RepID=A0A9N9FAY1_9GLOM|nr:13963_t:CDS:2 [Ambispora leptoticha]
MGIQAFVTWQGNNKDNKQQNSEKDDLEIEKLKRDLGGYQGNYTLYEWDDKKGYLGINGFDEIPNTSPNGIRIGEGILLFSEETKKHFSQIANDIDEWINNEEHKLSPLQGLSETPGTGKTEFVRELNHLLIKRYGEEPQIYRPNDPNDPNSGMTEDPEEKARALRGIKKPRIPVFEIKGADIMSTGKNEPKTYEKLVTKEGDQAKNPLTYSSQAKNNLEELKNFFSTGAESRGLAVKSQDRNSVFIVATNNYETVDPAMKR